MVLQIPSKADFIGKFLAPVSKVNNSCILKLTESGVSTLLAAADNTVILYGQYTSDLGITEDTIINLPDLLRLMKIMQCVNDDQLTLQLDSNCIKYTSNDVRFKYHLLDDGILSSPPVSVEKIKKTVSNYNTNFTLHYSSLISLIKNSAFAFDINKVYFFTKDDGVYAEIDDKQRHNVDSFSLKICDGFEGDPIIEPLPVSFETIRVIAGVRCKSIDVFVNTELNVFTFDVNNKDTKITYIISGLSK